MLSLFTRLTLLALLPLLLLTTLLTLLIVLGLTVLGQLFHLLLQLLGLTAQHLLLPALLHGLRAVALLLGQLFLATGQGIELLQSIVDRFGALFCRRAGLRCLVLVFLRVQFKVEEAGKITTCASSTAATTTALLAERNLYLAEGRLGTQQVLQRFLFRRDRVVPLHLLQLFGRWRHGRGGRLHVMPKAVEFLIRRRQIPAIHARCQCQRLLLQFGLHFGEELARFRRVLGRGCLFILALPGRGDQLLLALGNVRLASRRHHRRRHLRPSAAIAKTRAQTDRPG